MILNLRGNHASGKTTVVRKLLAHFPSKPIFGALGPRMPEAYLCETGRCPFYILGPYNVPGMAGCDYVTMRGMALMLELLDKYVSKGDILYEGVLLSVRILAPTIGKWLLEHKDDVRILILDTTLEQCLAALKERQDKSAYRPGKDDTLLQVQQRQFERVKKHLQGQGFGIEYVSRDKAVKRIIECLKQPH
jgi:hypothetical protein